MDMDFSGRRVLVVGGSSGIGNGIARAFLDRGAQVHVWGTRPSAEDYAGSEGSDLSGLGYSQVDASDPSAVEAASAPFDGLDVLVLSQGTVLYNRGEYEMEGFAQGRGREPQRRDGLRPALPDALAASRGSLIIISSTAAFHSTRGKPGLQRLQDRADRA